MQAATKVADMYAAVKPVSRDGVTRVEQGVLPGAGEGEWKTMLMASRDPDDGVVYWTLSAMLWPLGRSSVDHDWHLLGQYTGQLAKLSGAELVLLTPIETTHPNDIHFWAWRDDGKPMSQEKIDQAKKTIATSRETVASALRG